ncbi:hypothetical protein [Halodesulfovibrio marinisediminis]|uniref:Uncharacterized protein n=1 Tax=Halodesulfovibrio marinisediminis DSM 17456 TaxID=1121457 RepID=A0A1N6F4G8_9BACT|nr:hypothetical protein [Halodesulfovibrio marinisediminis]SIN90147.1 hypothetical protein SAMN02745161_1094 [Halodesulfovibrio marinisediminis DSM 17456]
MQMTPIESDLFENFDALLGTYNISNELTVLGLGKFSFFRKKKAKHELIALFYALWKLALKQSFPKDHELYFTNYCEAKKLDKDAAGNATMLYRSVEVYNTLLAEQGTKNFSNVADFLTDQLVKDSDRREHITLKLALSIRSTYNVIFQKLISN